jgi:hypothetical protein
MSGELAGAEGAVPPVFLCGSMRGRRIVKADVDVELGRRSAWVVNGRSPGQVETLRRRDPASAVEAFGATGKQRKRNRR